jgi:DNA-3-methyladenine glycosylase II
MAENEKVEIFRYSDNEIKFLAANDPILAAAIRRIGRIERPVVEDLFSALVRAIIAQQISNKAAATVWRRVQERFPEFTPRAVAQTPTEEIQQLGMSTRKAGYIQGAAAAINQGTIDLAGLVTLPDEEVIQRLSSLPGIGMWTAEMLLIFSMQRPDVVSWGDLGIRRGMKILYQLESLDRSRFDEIRGRYSPYGSTASLYLWHIAME